MLDLWIGDLFLALTIPMSMFSALYLRRPRLQDGDGISFLSPETLQEQYRKRYPIRLCLFRIIPILFALYFGFRAIFLPAVDKDSGPNVATWFAIVLIAFVASVLGSMVVRIRQELSFLKKHPGFSDSLLPLKPRIFSMIPLVVSLALITVGFFVEDQAIQTIFCLFGIIAVMGTNQMQSRQIRQARYQLPWDEALGSRIAEVVGQFGITPKQLILMPSFTANALAMHDGTVIVTSALRTIASPDEVAAVVAHELSHVRDGEGKKIQRCQQAMYLCYCVVICGAIVANLSAPLEPLMLPLIGFGLTPLTMGMNFFFCRFTRPMEFKCDADAAKLGMGPDLASCLDKLTRFMGMPNRWIGLDRFLLTHPSLEERVARLTSVA